MVDLTNVQNLTGVLQVLSGGDDRQVKKIEKTLKPFLKNVNCVLPLMQILCGGSDDAVRQQAGVLLKKKIGYFASRFTSQQQSSLKTQLVERLLAETTTAVANTIVGIIAATTVSLQWPELAQLLKQLINSPNEQHRVLAFTLLSELSEVGLPFPTKLICEVLLAGCQDSGDAIAEAALTAITNCIPVLEQNFDLMALSPIFPPFLELLNRCLENGEDELVISGFESIQETFSFEQPMINEHVEAIAGFLLKLLLDTDLAYERSVKDAASDTLVYLIERRGKQFIKKKLVKPTLSMLMDRIAQENGCVLQDSLSQQTRKGEQGDVNENEENKNATLESCQALIDKMAKVIPAKSFADIVFEMSEEAISSTDIGKRKAGCFLLGTVIEGLRDSARERIDKLLQLVVQGLDDSDLHVREAAAFALGQFAEHAYPEVYLYHHVIIPAGIKGLNDEGLIVQVHSCYAIENLCEQLQPITIKPYLSSLVSHVGQLAQSKIPSVQEAAVCALSTTATAAEEEFLPYVDEMMAFLEPLLILFDDREEIWSAALGCVGHIAIAVGKELIKPAYYELGMKAVMEGLKSEKHKIIESSLIHVANMAKLMKKDFEPKMNDLMMFIFEFLEEKEFEVANENDEDEIDEDDDEDDGEQEIKLKLNDVEGIVLKKVAAIAAIGCLAQHTKSCFLPYLDQARNLFTYSHGGALFSTITDVRSEAASVFHQFIEVRCDVANIPTPAPCERLELPEVVKELAALVLMHCFHIVDHDDEKKVVSEAIEAIGSVFKRLGVAVFDLPVREVYDPKEKPCSTVITHKILAYLDERGNCQTVNRFDDGHDDDEDTEEDDEENHLHLLMESLGDMIGTLATVSGPDFVPYFDKFHPKLLKFTKPSRSQADRDMAICCYADVFKGLGSASLNYSDSVLPVLQSALEDLEGLEAARRNAAFCLGMLIEATGEALVPHYLQFLQWLRPVCVRNETDEEEEDVGGADVDNALGAVARMILVASNAIPLNQVLPVMFAALPLREDFDECHAVFKAFLHLVEKNDPAILGRVEKLVPLLIESFGPDSEVPDEARNVAGHILAILAANPSCMDAVHNSLLSISDQEHLKSLQSGLYAHGMFWTGKLDF